VDDKAFAFPHAVSGQAPWSHWHAISTSLAPASLQDGPQNLSPGCARHRHGRCPHLFCSAVVIVRFSVLSAALNGRFVLLPPHSYPSLVSNSCPAKAGHNCSHFGALLGAWVPHFSPPLREMGFAEIQFSAEAGRSRRSSRDHQMSLRRSGAHLPEKESRRWNIYEKGDKSGVGSRFITYILVGMLNATRKWNGRIITVGSC
jgi:hypothetical protein